MRVTRFLVILLVLLNGMLPACGNDDSVTSSSSPCLDENTTCLTLTAVPADMAFSTYDDGSTSTFNRYLIWTRSATLKDFRPGQKINIVVLFNPPLVVVYDHPAMFFGLYMQDGTGGSNSYVHVATTVESGGTLAASTASTTINGSASSDDLTCDIICDFGNLQAGQELKRLQVSFTVPDTFSDGAGAGNEVPATDFPITQFAVESDLNAPQAGPAVWPQGEPLP